MVWFDKSNHYRGASRHLDLDSISEPLALSAVRAPGFGPRRLFPPVLCVAGLHGSQAVYVQVAAGIGHVARGEDTQSGGDVALVRVLLGAMSGYS